MVPMKFAFIFLAVLQGITVTLAEDTTTSSTEAAPTDPSTPDTTDPSTPDTTDATFSTTASPCEDDPHVNCAKLKPQCSDHRYDELMNQYCRKTCGRCGDVIPTNTTCFDAFTQCQVWKANGFCNNSFYTEEIRKQYCQKTCDLC